MADWYSGRSTEPYMDFRLRQLSAEKWQWQAERPVDSEGVVADSAVSYICAGSHFLLKDPDEGRPSACCGRIIGPTGPLQAEARP